MNFASYANLHKINRLVRLKDEIHEIYLNQVIQTFAISLIGIFIPIYLLKIGFDIFMVFNYFLIFFTFNSVFSLLFSRAFPKIGLKHSMFLSTIPLTTLYILLQFLGHFRSYELFYTIPVVHAVWGSLYWVPLHSEFIKHSHKISEGSEIGNLFAFPKLAATFGPIFGALILKSIGFDVLFIVVITIIMLSIGPLFLTSDSIKRFHFRFSDFILFFRNRSHIYLFAEGIYAVAEVVAWPVFVYLVFRDIISIGILATLSSLGIIIFTFVVGRLANRGVNKRKIMKWGGILYGATLIARPFVSSLDQVFLLSFLGGMFSTMIIVSVYARFCDEARQRNIIAANVARHIWFNLGKALPVIVLFYLFGFEAFFIVSGIAVMALLLI